MKLSNKIIITLLVSLSASNPLMSKGKAQVKLSMAANQFSQPYKVDSLVVTGEYTEEDLFHKMRANEGEALLQVEYLDLSKSVIINENYDEGGYVIDNYALKGCKTLKHIVFPKNLTTIGSHLFEECPNLHTIVLPDSLKEIRPMAFVNCPTLRNVSISPSNKFYCTQNNSLFDKRKRRLYFVPPASMGDYILPPQISHVEDAAFHSCNKIKSVQTSSLLKSIGDFAFYGCSDLSHIDIPSAVERIGAFAFFKCTSLKTIRMPKKLKTLGKFAFSGCEELETVHVESEQFKNDYLFAGCPKLTAFVVSEDNPRFSAKDGVLFDKAGMVLVAYPNAKGSDYEIPVSVEKIGSCSFYDCVNLKSIQLPSQLKVIERAAFSNCKDLGTIRISADIPPTVHESSFAMVSKQKCVLYVPNNSLKAYKEHPVWGKFSSIVGF